MHQVTPLSKYLALALFIILPFIGGYIGYTFAPEKVVEVEKVVFKESTDEPDSSNQIDNSVTPEESSVRGYTNEEYGFSFSYPLGWRKSDKLDYGLGYTPIVSVYNTANPAVPNSDSGGDSVSVSLLDDSAQAGGYRHECFELTSNATSPIIGMFGWNEHDGMGDARQLCMRIEDKVFSFFLRSDNILAV